MAALFVGLWRSRECARVFSSRLSLLRSLLWTVGGHGNGDVELRRWLRTVTLPAEGTAIGLPKLVPIPQGDEPDGPATFPHVLFRTRTEWDDTPVVKALNAKAPSVAFALA